MSTLAEDLERNVHEIIRNLMNNLASLGYEAGFELQTHPPTTTTEAAIKGANFTASYIRIGVAISVFMGWQLQTLIYNADQTNLQKYHCQERFFLVLRVCYLDKF